MTHQAPAFWPQIQDSRIRFAPVFKGPGWLAVLKVQDPDNGLSPRERQSLLELGFLKGSEGRFIYPKTPDNQVLEAVATTFRSKMEVLKPDQVVLLNGSQSMNPVIPDELRSGIAWWFGNHPQRMLNEIRASLRESDDEQAMSLLESLTTDQWQNIDRLKGWVADALNGEINPVTEPILGLGLARVSGIYKGEVPEEISEWQEKLAVFRGDETTNVSPFSNLITPHHQKSQVAGPVIGEMVTWYHDGASERGRVIRYSEEDTSAVWVSPIHPQFVNGIVFPGKVRVPVSEILGYESKPAQAVETSENTIQAQLSGEVSKALLSLDDIESEEIRELKDDNLISDHARKLVRGVHKTHLIRGQNPIYAGEMLAPNSMVTHWHFVRSELGAELGGDTPEVRNAAAYVRDLMIEEFNKAQPELPVELSGVLAVIPVETTHMAASDELARPDIQEKLDRETVYGIGLHPRFLKSIRTEDFMQGVEALNDFRIEGAYQQVIKAMFLAPHEFSALMPYPDQLGVRRLSGEWAGFDPAETADTDYDALVQRVSGGRLFFKAEDAGKALSERMTDVGVVRDLVRNNEAVIASVMQLAGESHEAVESLPHPLFRLATEIQKAGVMQRASKAEVLAVLGVDLGQHLDVMGQLAILANIRLPLVSAEEILEQNPSTGEQGMRAQVLAGIVTNKNGGARPFSIGIVATEEQVSGKAFGAKTILRQDDLDSKQVAAPSLGRLVNLNRLSPIRFGDSLGENLVVTDEAMASLEPNWFEVDTFTAIYEDHVYNRPMMADRLKPSSSMPGMNPDAGTSLDTLSNRLGAMEKGLQTLAGSWRDNDKARESLVGAIRHWLQSHKHFQGIANLDRIADDLANALERTIGGEMITVLSKKTSRSTRWQDAIVTTSEIVVSDFSRMEAAELVALRFKNRNPRYNKYTVQVFDAMSALRPEALKYLNDKRAQAEKIASAEKDTAGTGQTAKRGARQNRGLVAGLSVKDMRGSVETVLNHLSSATEIDQQKLCKKTRLWEAPDWASLRSGEGEGQAMEPAVAAYFSDFRKALPSDSPVNTKKVNLLFAKAMLMIRDTFNEVRTYDELKKAVDGPFSENLMKIELEAEQIGVNAQLILGKNSGWMRLKDIQEHKLGVANRRTKQNTEWPNDLITQRAAANGGQKNLTGAMPALTRLVREGAPDHRNGLDTDEETLIRTFGFSGVEYGESMTQAERTTYLNHAYDGFMDLATALDVSPRSLSLGGTLGLAFGSRGRGGRRAALAHFEPSNNVINLTRMKGAGSMAHEMGHAIANYFSRMVSGKSRGGGDLAESVAAGGSIRPMREDRIGELRKPIYDAFSVIMANAFYEISDEDDFSNLEKFSQFRHARSSLKKSADLEDSRRRSRQKYWSTPAEIFARSFETWVNETLKEKNSNFRNDFLVRPDKLREWGVPPDEQRQRGDKVIRTQLYPSGKQLEILGKAFGSLVKSMKEGTKRVQHEHLGAVDLPYLYSRDTGSIQRLHREDMGPMAQCVIGELARMCGPEMEVRFERELKDDHGSLVAGRFSTIEGDAYKPGRGVRGLVELAHGAPMSVAWHEAFHFAQEILLTDDERSMLDYSFSPGSELHERLVLSLTEENKPDLVEACNDPREAQAYAYQQWVAGSLDLKVEEQPRTLFGEIKNFFKTVFNVTEETGFSKPEQLFQAFYDGRLSARANLQETLATAENSRYQTVRMEEWDFEDQVQHEFQGAGLG